MQHGKKASAEPPDRRLRRITDITDWKVARLADNDRSVLLVILILALALRLTAAFRCRTSISPMPRAIVRRRSAVGHRQDRQLRYHAALSGARGYRRRGVGPVSLDIVLSTVMVALVYQLTLAIFPDRVAAALAALATAFYPYFIFYAVVGLTETLFIVLLLGAFLCWFRGGSLRLRCSQSCRS